MGRVKLKLDLHGIFNRNEDIDRALNERVLRLNSAVFFSEADDQQQGTQEFDASGAIWFRTVNTGRSEYKGVELEVLANPVDAFQLESSVGYIDYDRVDQLKGAGGIRIEDNVLVTETGCRVLGPPIPKEMAEVEALACA